jgi:hypothetical protein
MDVSFKFNEIKFCTLLMNWLILEKVFIYSYNKFMPVNCMYYMKCGVNSSLHSSGCYRRSGGTLGHYYIMTHSIHN